MTAADWTPAGCHTPLLTNHKAEQTGISVKNHGSFYWTYKPVRYFTMEAEEEHHPVLKTHVIVAWSVMYGHCSNKTVWFQQERNN